MKATNGERQSDEIAAISSICEEEEFSRSPDRDYELTLDVFPIIERGKLDIKYSNVLIKNSPKQIFRRFSVKNLPPSCLRLHLPPEYPEFQPPLYLLEIPWLPPWQCSLICQKLDELWEENSGSEILFVWRNFLRNEILDFLNCGDTLDVSYLFAIYDEPQDFVTTSFFNLSDERAKNGVFFLHPRRYLSRYDETRSGLVFSRTFHICEICSQEHSGRNCVQFADCDHVACKNCTAEYLAERIGNNKGKKIYCPYPNCYSVATGELIKRIHPDLYEKYDDSLLKQALDFMNDVVFCPRKTCQFPAIAENGETLATCGQCEYSFCRFCRKGYHGVAPCAMSSEASRLLLDAYLSSDKSQKQQLLKKYGTKQIQLVAEEHLSREYLNSNTKPCPGCRSRTEKINGCNKMSCAYCGENFCWLCGVRITSRNAYEHFNKFDGANGCFGRLFEGMPGAAEDDEMPGNHARLPDAAG